MSPIVYHIPICPFCQRLEVLLQLKGLFGVVEFEVVDVTAPRSQHILNLTGGTTALPVMELEDGTGLKESLVLMQYLEERFHQVPIQSRDPAERGIEDGLVRMEAEFVARGYRLVMNQDPALRDNLIEAYLDHYARLDSYLRRHATIKGPWLLDRFGWAETVYTPFFQRFVFVSYYEGVDLPNEERFDRVRAWREACVAHPAAQQTCDEEIIKLYYDYARGLGNGALAPGRTKSSFAFEPRWELRPMPPRDKYGPGATDDDLGLIGR